MQALPQLGGSTFITDGGLETTLIFHAGLDLPDFAAFVLLDSESGRRSLREYYAPYVEIARRRRAGVILDTPTWRASADWGERLGYTAEALADVNRRSVELLEELRDGATLLISGCVGPRGDGYRVERLMSADEAERYHGPQVTALAGAAADLVTALTMTYAAEAVGVTRAATAAGLPVVISFTVETDGRLPDGQALGDAIEQVDAETSSAPAYFMINCAHPTHLTGIFERPGAWVERIRGLRANASRMSHAELDEAETLDEGDPAELAQQYGSLAPLLPNLTIVGGCCGTDARHVDAVCAAFV
jgi:S-methylmethionine-dependent homocysteine/selenocysteine methylase